MARRSLARLGLTVLQAAALLIAAVAAPAQTTLPAPSAVLTIDPERLFEQSQFGLRILAESEAKAEELQAENRSIEAQLTEEERSLTERRPELAVDEFRALADAFDEKVTRIRAEQDSKAREVQTFRDAAQQDFFNRIGPILLALVRERRAAILLDRRTVFLSAEAVDITDTAISKIDAEIGDGATESPPEPGDGQ